MNMPAFHRILCVLLALLSLPAAEAQQGGSGESTQSAPLRPDEDTVPTHLYISGTVVQEGGAPGTGAFIELDCRGSVTKEGMVDSSGRFSFRLGEGIRFNQQDQDLSQGVTDPFGRSSTMIPFDVGTISTRNAKGSKKPPAYPAMLTGCMLRASLSGYKSSTIELGTAPLSMLSQVGTIVLYPVTKVRGARVSATSLRAPKNAKKAMEKAMVALRKERADDSEKYLKSAIGSYPQFSEAWFLLGRLYQMQRRFQEAREAYRRSIECDNLYVNPFFWLGLISAAEQNWPDAADLTARALALDPTAFPEAHYLNALANFNLKNPDQAERSALQAELLDSTHRFPKLHLMLSSLFAGKNDTAGSIEELRKYLKYGPRGYLAIQRPERAPYLDSGWETAGESLKKEMASDAGHELHLMLAEALSGAGMPEPAKAELAAYLKDGDRAKVPPQLRGLLEPAPNHDVEHKASASPEEKAAVPKENPIDYLNFSLKDQPDFEPAADQAPLEGILAAVGKNVSGLFADLFNLSAIESVHMERVDRKGQSYQSRNSEYLYLCMGAVDKQNPYFDEFRSDEQGRETLQLGLEEGYMLTAGFVSAPLLFHPIHQNGNSFRLLGYQKLRGRNSIVVAYAQIPSRSRLQGHFQVGKNVQETYKQGLAWIDAENHQIIRLVSDLLKPLPQIALEKLRTEIDFGRIRFDQAREDFWLPIQVAVNVNWNGKLLRNTHVYSDFRRFDVQASQKIDKPKESGKKSQDAGNPQSH